MHPQIATVTYLSDWGAPTVVLNKRTPTEYGQVDESDIDEGSISWPELYKHISFDGRYLHAAPSQLASRHILKPPENYRRISFLVNIWIDYIPMGVDILPSEVISELALSDLHVPLSWSNEMKIANLTVSHQPIGKNKAGAIEVERLCCPFGATGTEYTVSMTVPCKFPLQTSMNYKFSRGCKAYLRRKGEEEKDTNNNRKPKATKKRKR